MFGNEKYGDPEFQSTPSVRRATTHGVDRGQAPRFQSTPSVRRATSAEQYLVNSARISIHALRAEGDGNGRSIGDV